MASHVYRTSFTVASSVSGEPDEAPNHIHHGPLRRRFAVDDALTVWVNHDSDGNRVNQTVCVHTHDHRVVLSRASTMALLRALERSLETIEEWDEEQAELDSRIGR